MANNFDMIFNNTSEQTQTPEVADVIAIAQTSDAPVKIPFASEIIDKIILARDSTEILKLFCDLLTIKACKCCNNRTKAYPSIEKNKDRRKNFDSISSLIYDELITKKGLYQITLKHFKDLVIDINYTYYFNASTKKLKNFQTALDKIERALDDLEIKLKCESGDSTISIDRIVSTDLNGNVVKYQPGNIQILPLVLNSIKQELNLENEIDYKKYEIRVRNKFSGNPCICEICEIQIVGDNINPYYKNTCKRCYKNKKSAWDKENYKNNKDKRLAHKKE